MNNNDFDLKEHRVSPSDLVLDPHNPRLQNGTYSQKRLTDSEITSTEIQDYVLKRMHEKEHSVQKLIDSMRSNGFINIDSIFVKRLTASNKFLVLEGNRRTTAIKYLLANERELDAKVARSLSMIPVKELICDDALHDDKAAFILAIRHLGGVKEWAPMQQAYQIYNQYMGELLKQPGVLEFRKDADLVAKLSNTLNQDKKDIWKALRIFVAFNQLKQNDYLVKSDHYSLLDLAINHYPSLRNRFFEVTENNFQMSNKGLEKFNKLCIQEGHKIKNPKQFREFFYIFRDGTENDLRLAEDGEKEFSEIRSRISRREDTFFNHLEDIKNRLDDLVITSFKQTLKEENLILQVKRIVDKKLVSLIS